MRKQATLTSFLTGDTEKKIVETLREETNKFDQKCDNSYIKFGFIVAGDASDQNPLCVECRKKLANEAMKLSKPGLEPVDYFERRLEQQ